MDIKIFEWHDAVLLKIDIDRNHQRDQDTIEFHILWPDEHRSIIIFQDVYELDMRMNFGVAGLDCIDEAYIEEENHALLDNFYEKWKGLMDDVELREYVIKTSTTGSVIRILAKGFEEKLL